MHMMYYVGDGKRQKASQRTVRQQQKATSTPSLEGQREEASFTQQTLVMVGLSGGKLADEGVQLLPEHPWNRDGEILWFFPSFHSPISLAVGSPSWTLADRGS